MILLPEKITQCPKAWLLFNRTQIAVKTKTFKLLSSNEAVFIPKIVILKPRIRTLFTLINNLVKSESYKRNSLLIYLRRVQEKILKRLFVGPFKRVLFRAWLHHKIVQKYKSLKFVVQCFWTWPNKGREQQNDNFLEQLMSNFRYKSNFWAFLSNVWGTLEKLRATFREISNNLWKTLK